MIAEDDGRKCPHHKAGTADFRRIDTEWERCQPKNGASCKFTRKVKRKKGRKG